VPLLWERFVKVTAVPAKSLEVLEAVRLPRAKSPVKVLGAGRAGD
jgi:hypothetical protein